MLEGMGENKVNLVDTLFAKNQPHGPVRAVGIATRCWMGRRFVNFAGSDGCRGHHQKPNDHHARKPADMDTHAAFSQPIPTLRQTPLQLRIGRESGIHLELGLAFDGPRAGSAHQDRFARDERVHAQAKVKDVMVVHSSFKFLHQLAKVGLTQSSKGSSAQLACSTLISDQR